MEIYEKLKVDYDFCDERGHLTQLVHDGYKQVNVLESKKGVKRGGHYHKISSEAFFVVSGCVEVTLKNGEEKKTIKFSKNDFFLILPKIVHSLYFLDDCILVAMYDIPVELPDGTKDIYLEEPLPNE